MKIEDEVFLKLRGGYKIGDKVKVVHIEGQSYGTYVGEFGTIVDLPSTVTSFYYIQLSKAQSGGFLGPTNSIYLYEDEFELCQ